MENISSSNSQKALVPKLRFTEFKEEWVSVQLSDFVNRIMRKNTNNETDLPLTISSKDGLVNQITYFNKTVASKDMSGYYLLLNGEFAYNKSYSVGFDFGSIKRLDRYSMGALSTLYICFALKKYDADFIKTYFDSLQWYREIYMIAAEGARNHGLLNVSTEEFFATRHILPDNINEQKKIASFFLLIDARIEKQRQLVDALKLYKRGAIKQIWASESKSGWICDKICNLGDFRKGAALSKADISDEGLPMILYGELYTTYTEVITSVVRKTKAKVDDVFLSRVGDVIMPTSGETPEEISTASCVMQPGVILAGDLLIYRSSCVDGRIVSYALNHIINDKIARIAQGKSIVHVQGSEIGNIEIALPPLNLQTKYAEYLDRLSQNIIAEEKIYEQLLRLKSSLLKQMFV